MGLLTNQLSLTSVVMQSDSLESLLIPRCEFQILARPTYPAASAAAREAAQYSEHWLHADAYGTQLPISQAP